jgi:hypothetical protein
MNFQQQQHSSMKTFNTHMFTQADLTIWEAVLAVSTYSLAFGSSRTDTSRVAGQTTSRPFYQALTVSMTFGG